MRSGFWFSIIVSIILCAPALAYDWSTNPGDGSETNPYQISEPEHLMSIGSDPNLLDKHFILIDDIAFDPTNNPAHVFSSAVIAPYQNSSSPTFSGNFDGNGHKIINLTVVSNGYNVGLFGNLIGSDQDEILVRDLTFVNPNIAGPQNAGVMAGRMKTCTVENCHIIGGIVSRTGGNWMGGLTGSCDYAVISNCSSSATISGNTGIGGLAGAVNSGGIQNCSATGNVSGTNNYVGGLAGYVAEGDYWQQSNHREIINCSATGTVHSDTGRCGGLIGFLTTGLIQNCYASGMVTGGSYLGGLIGYVEATNQTSSFSGPTTINGCYAAGNVEGQGDYVGGLIGNNNAILVKDCYALGSAEGNSCIGGLIGRNLSKAVRCFSTGQVTGINSKGGLIGGYGDAFLSYWDINSSQISTSSGGTGKTTAEMMSLETYRGWGDNVWKLDEGNDYPHLAWENTPGAMIVDEHAYSGGSGSADDPYQIGTVDDLVALGLYTQDWDKNFVLTEDIVLDPTNLTDPDVVYDNANFNKIGVDGLPFTGYFNGQFHTIFNLRNQNDESYNALFGFIQGNGPQDTVVENLLVSSSVFKGDYAVGSIVGWLEDARLVRCGIEDFSILDDSQGLSNTNYHGGLVGFATNSTIALCYTQNGNFNLGKRTSGYGQGGLIGKASGSTIENSYAIATFQSAGGFDGGFVGEIWDSEIIRCYSVPSVSDPLYVQIAGFVGDSNTNPRSCYYRSGNGISGGDGGIGMSDAQMKQKGNFFGWDFVGEDTDGENEIWRMCVDGVDYPRLSWEFAQNGDFACGDGVDLADLQALAEHWLLVEANDPAGFNYACDANGDEKIDFLDYAVLGKNW